MGWPGPQTHRQFLAWQAWHDDDLGRPGKQEPYLMQLAQELRALSNLVVSLGGGKPGPLPKFEDWAIKYGRAKTPAERQADLEALAAAAKAVWLGRVGGVTESLEA